MPRRPLLLSPSVTYPLEFRALWDCDEADVLTRLRNELMSMLDQPKVFADRPEYCMGLFSVYFKHWMSMAQDLFSCPVPIRTLAPFSCKWTTCFLNNMALVESPCLLFEEIMMQARMVFHIETMCFSERSYARLKDLYMCAETVCTRILILVAESSDSTVWVYKPGFAETSYAVWSACKFYYRARLIHTTCLMLLFPGDSEMVTSAPHHACRCKEWRTLRNGFAAAAQYATRAESLLRSCIFSTFFREDLLSIVSNLARECLLLMDIAIFGTNVPAVDQMYLSSVSMLHQNTNLDIIPVAMCTGWIRDEFSKQRKRHIDSWNVNYRGQPTKPLPDPDIRLYEGMKEMDFEDVLAYFIGRAQKTAGDIVAPEHQFRLPRHVYADPEDAIRTVSVHEHNGEDPRPAPLEEICAGQASPVILLPPSIVGRELDARAPDYTFRTQAAPLHDPPDYSAIDPYARPSAMPEATSTSSSSFADAGYEQRQSDQRTYSIYTSPRFRRTQGHPRSYNQQPNPPATTNQEYDGNTLSWSPPSLSSSPRASKGGDSDAWSYHSNYEDSCADNYHYETSEKGWTRPPQAPTLSLLPGTFDPRGPTNVSQAIRPSSSYDHGPSWHPGLLLPAHGAPARHGMGSSRAPTFSAVSIRKSHVRF